MKTMEIGRSNTILYCNRWESSVRFYKEVFNLPVTLEKEWFVEFQLTGDGYLSVADAKCTSVKGADGAGVTLSWKVENLEAVHKQLQSSGVDVGPLNRIWGARHFFLMDPEGNRIELWS
jgi:predicted enzyme related to lactoylglutathione lyase